MVRTVLGVCLWSLGLLFLPTQALYAEGAWPQWRGPLRDGVSQEEGLLQEWPEKGPPQVWLYRDCGVGYSGPAIVDNCLYILGTRDQEEHLICLDVAEGEEMWTSAIGPIYKNGWGDGPRSTPTVDGEVIFTLSAKGNLNCNRADNGEQIWQVAMQDFGGSIPVWGYSESPLVYGNMVLCTPGGEEGAIIALDKASGELLWQSKELTDIAHYSSIVLMESGNRELGVQLLVSQLVGFSLETGEVEWSVPWNGRVAVIPTPVIWKDSIYVTSGYGAGCMLARYRSVEEEYSNKVMVNHHGGVIRLKDCVYGHSDRKGWTCQDLETGDKRWQEKHVLGKGAIAYADNRFYCLSEDEGEVVLIEASEEGWSEKGRFTLSPQTEIRKPKGRIWTHPVIADGKLYVRDQDLLFCFDVTRK